MINLTGHPWLPCQIVNNIQYMLHIQYQVISMLQTGAIGQNQFWIIQNPRTEEAIFHDPLQLCGSNFQGK